VNMIAICIIKLWGLQCFFYYFKCSKRF